MSLIFTRKLRNRKILVDIFVIFFGIGSWFGVNSIYVQLPLLVHSAPEKWNLAVNLVMVVQFANLGPILYTCYMKNSTREKDHYIIYGLLGAGALPIYILSFAYDKTTVIFGSERSTVLLMMMFVSSFVGCTSSVLFIPYMKNYRDIYLISYLVGEGLSSFLPSIIALIQGVGGTPECRVVTKVGSLEEQLETVYPDPIFSTSAFFFFIGTLLLLSFLSFVSLNKFKVARGERVKLLPDSMEIMSCTDMMNTTPSYKTVSSFIISKTSYFTLLGMMGISFFLGNGILPSIQPYSCLPYGNVTYHLAVKLASLSGPLATCSGFIIKKPKVNLLSALMVVVLILTTIVFYLALQSPHPPLQNTWLGGFVIVILWIVVTGLIGFIKMGVSTLFREDPGRGLYYAGVATQLGSLIGATSSFALFNWTKMFHQYDHCTILTEPNS